MARLNSWLSADALHALGWALIHSLWQCLAVAALAAGLMAFMNRPSVRYIVASCALALMLAAPVATFFVLMKDAAPVRAFLPVSASVSAAPAPVNTGHAAATSRVMDDGVIGAWAPSPVAIALERSQNRFLSPNVLPWLVGAWLCGVALFSLRFAGGFLLLEHRRRRQSILPAPRVLVLCGEVQRQLGLDRAIRYLECGWLQTPAVIGWIRPVVLLPVTALIGLDEEQLRAVIAHELAHIRRHDWLVNLFQILVEALLFYHPAMWWLNRRIRAERELCCDEIAVSVTGNRLEYARALARMAEWKSAPMLAMAANRGPLADRIMHILGRKPSGTGQRVMGLSGGALFLVAALAAANALFGIAYPIPAAHAKASLKPAAVSIDRLPRQSLQTSEPAVKTAEPDQASPNDTTGPNTMAAAQDDVMKQSEKLLPPSPDLSRLQPTKTLVAPVVVALRDARVAPPNDQPAPSAAPASAQASLSNPAATPAKAGPDEQAILYLCRNTSVFGRVISPKAIQMQGFACLPNANGSSASSGGDLRFGSCPLASTTSAHARDCPWDVTLNVQLADSGEAGKMQPGKLVRLGGDFRVTRQHQTVYLTVENAKVLFVDFFWGAAARSPGAPNVGPFYSGGYSGYNGSPGDGGDPSISAGTPSPFGQGGVHF